MRRWAAFLLVAFVLVATLGAGADRATAGTIYIPMFHRAVLLPEPPFILSISPLGADEVITIVGGSIPIDMTTWSIQSADGTIVPTCPYVESQTFTFPSGFVLAPRAIVRIHSGPGAFGIPPGDLFWSSTPMWSDYGDRGRLIGPAGFILHSMSYGLCQ